MAQTPIPIYSQREPFYVPRFQVFIRGKQLPSDVVEDILQVTYKDNVNEIDSFSIDINNWDATGRTFKFAPPLKEYVGVFDPGTPVEIWMGYQNDMRQMMRGEITSLAATFPEGGAPTLTITGLNELHKFRTEQHTYSWDKKSDSDIAKELCGLPVQKGKPGLGIPLDPNSTPSSDETPETFVFMNNQYDIVFLLERARRHGYEVYLKNTDKKQKQTLYFGLSESNAVVPVYQLEWGKSLLNFKPTLSTAKQVSQVTVCGWDRTANKRIEEKFSLQDLWKKQNKSATEIARLSKIAEAYGNRSEIVTDKPVHTKAEARKLAEGILTNQDNKLIEGTGATVGLPDLRAGCALRIIGFGIQSTKKDKKDVLVGNGSDFDGEYYVTQTTHSIGGSGYRTDFSARREGPVKTEKTQSS
jgi:phage protein D